MAELVGGAILSAFLPVLFERLASPEFRKFFDGQILQGELKKLKITLNSVNGLLTDAEEKQITKPDVKIWLDHLREAIYEADDLLDEIEYKALKSKLKATSWMEKATGFISKYKIRQRLEAILNTLQLLLDQKDTLGLAEKLSLPPKTPTTSLRDDDDDSEIDTRVKDKEAIIESLLSDSDSLVVMPIWGMGGIGKTTLAQLVYNDTRIEAQFQHRPWIFVSEVFDVTRVTKDILRVVNPESSNYDRLDMLQRQLLKEFSSLERKLLIVLDDFWSDNTRDWYTFLKPFLEVEARKAMIKIVVTTRHESVASLTLTGPVEVRHLNELTDRECWYLLEKHAFVKDDSNAYPQLKAHGEKIAKNCRGLPLAAKTIGRLLSAERDVQKWKEISSSDIWDLKNEDINSALRLSYHYLSSLSKRCFAYCALFPKGYEFGKKEVVLLWMAEGFFVQAQGNNSKKEMEEIGNGHFNDLVTRSFFQRSKGSKSHFVMHDLFNDLAKFVSGEFCSRLEGNNSSNIVKRTRHVSYADVELDSVQKFSGACKDNVLRTFISLERRSTLKTDEVIHGLLQTLGRPLRVLSLSQYQMVDLSDSISKFKLLRYLNLSGASFKSFSTPTKLYFLQILILRECPNLVALPSNMSKLIKLCHLDIRGTKLLEMPPQMGELKKLRKLTDFFLGEQSGSSIKELGKLQELQGELCIWNLQHVEKAKDAAEANLCGKEKLVKLELRWDRDIRASIDPTHEKSVLESLEPHKGLDYLSIYDYGGTRFPDWVGHSSFSCMVSLELTRCGNCSSLPPLGQLPSLEYLTIGFFYKVEVVGREFYGSCTSMKKPFGSLKVLRFSYMRGWREWISCEGAFPVLQELHIRRSNNLERVALPGHLPCLTTLDVGGCQQFAAALQRAPAILRVITADVQLKKLPSGLYSLTSYRFEFAMEIMERIGLLPNALEEIVIYDSYSLGSFPLKLFSEVNTLKVGRCGNLDDFFTPEANANFTSLDSLEIEECRYFVSFPEGGLPASNLTRLSLYDCSSLKSLPQNMRSLLSSLVYLSIMRCPALESFPKDGLPSSLSSLSIRYCPQLEPFPKGCLPEKLESLDVGHDCNKLIAGHMQWDLQTLPSLVKIAIESCDDVEAFPGEMLLPSTLISLVINGFQNLKSVDFKGLQDLKNLTVVNCPKLELFVGGVLPSQLESLGIYQCGKLIAHLMHWDLRAASSLLELTIEGYDGVDMVSFPGKMLLPSTLASLDLLRLENLKFLDKGLLHLTSLKKLRLDRCYNLQSLPEEGLPSSLTSLVIVVCRLLQPKCELGGEYRPLISQIPQVMMD